MEISEVKKIITDKSKELGVDETLALAIASVESHFNTLAVRFEPEFKYTLNIETHAKAANISYATEKVFQATSLGVMQIMGLVARECGFKGNLARLIVEPELAIHYSLIKLKKLCDRYENEDHVIAAYNRGSVLRKNNQFVNQEYVDKVKTQLKKLRSSIL